MNDASYGDVMFFQAKCTVSNVRLYVLSCTCSFGVQL
jgi:hypothetical protein